MNFLGNDYALELRPPPQGPTTRSQWKNNPTSASYNIPLVTETPTGLTLVDSFDPEIAAKYPQLTCVDELPTQANEVPPFTTKPTKKRKKKRATVAIVTEDPSTTLPPTTTAKLPYKQVKDIEELKSKLNKYSKQVTQEVLVNLIAGVPEKVKSFGKQNKN